MTSNEEKPILQACEPFLENLWRWKVGIPEIPVNIETIGAKINEYRQEELLKIKEAAWNKQYDSLRETEWSPTFEELMRHRLIMGSFRYGLIGAEGKPTYDRTSSCVKRLQRYQETGNKEYLVDVANLCLMEFVEGDGHFESIDDDNVHCEIK